MLFHLLRPIGLFGPPEGERSEGWWRGGIPMANGGPGRKRRIKNGALENVRREACQEWVVSDEDNRVPFYPCTSRHPIAACFGPCPSSPELEIRLSGRSALRLAGCSTRCREYRRGRPGLRCRPNLKAGS